MDRPRRVRLALWWGLFYLLWLPATAFVMLGVGLGVCGGDGGEPYAAPGSARDHYCNAIPAFNGPLLLLLVGVAGSATVILAGSKRVLIAIVTMLSLATLLFAAIPTALTG